jgi:L-rhamnonate dehydratase
LTNVVHDAPRTKVVGVRASVRADRPKPVEAVGPAQGGDRPWQLRPIASPLSHYPGREVRTVGGPDWVGHFVVEVEAESGEIGVGVSVGGEAACWVVEGHLAEFVVGADVTELERVWDLMWRGSLFYGRRGLVVHAISAIDLALWDLFGKVSGRPVHELLGGPVRDSLEFYATTPDPAAARELGFIGCKLPLAHGMASGRGGRRANVDAFAEARDAVGDDLFLAYDCWMSLDVQAAVELAHDLAPFSPAWLEECLPPDDYWGHRTLRSRMPPAVALAGGEHEATRWGFRALTEIGGVDLLQPDPTWCGGLTELLRIIDDAEVGGRRVVTHGASAYGIHPSLARASVPYAECIITSSSGAQVAPTFGDLFVDEPLPQQGVLHASALTAPGFGLVLNPDLDLVRPTQSR